VFAHAAIQSSNAGLVGEPWLARGAEIIAAPRGAFVAISFLGMANQNLPIAIFSSTQGLAHCMHLWRQKISFLFFFGF
jgi:hypothetical protein